MLKILVVEDHALVREGLMRLLAQFEPGVVLRESADFESALSILEGEDEVDLLLLDLALPGIDGFVGLDILRRSAQGCRRPRSGSPTARRKCWRSWCAACRIAKSPITSAFPRVRSRSM